MRLVAMTLLAVAAATYFLVACNEVTTPTSAAFGLTITTWAPDPVDRAPLEDVKACQMDATDNCAWTDADGKATLMLPVGQTAYTLDPEEEYAPYLLPHVIPPSGSGRGFALITNEAFVDKHEAVGAPYPMRFTGTIVIDFGEPLVGATFELIDATGTGFYVDEDGHWRTDLTASSNPNGRWAGGFTEVSSGEFQVKVGGAGEGCWVRLGWPGDERDVIKVPVREGYVTRVTLACPALLP